MAFSTAKSSFQQLREGCSIVKKQCGRDDIGLEGIQEQLSHGVIRREVGEKRG